MTKRLQIILGIFITLIAIWISIAPNPLTREILNRLDHLGYDLQVRTHVLTRSKPNLAPIAIVDIDDKSIRAEGQWPWPRSKLAHLVNQIRAGGAAVIAFNIVFPDKEPNIAQELLSYLNKKKQLTPDITTILKKNLGPLNNDVIFANSLTVQPTVLAFHFLFKPHIQNQLPSPLFVLSSKDDAQIKLIESLGFIGNLALLQHAAQHGGFIDIFASDDGIYRKAPLIMEFGPNVYPSLALKAVLLFLHHDIQLITPSYDQLKFLEGIKIGPNITHTNEYGEVYIPFKGKSHTFPFYSASDVLNNNIAAGALNNKIIFIGTTATGLSENKVTAIDQSFSGVELQATIANGLLQNDFAYKPAWAMGANVVILLILGLAAAFIFPIFGPRVLTVIIFIFPLLVIFINDQFLDATGVVLSMLIPILVVLIIAIINLILGYLFESRRREQLKEMFGQYVPANHIDEMLKSHDSYALLGEDREMTVLFADIRDFTTISEHLTATELVSMLNAFFTPMTEIIFKHKGTVDKYVGDLIMAFWGAPLRDRLHARHAIAAALDMQKKIHELNTDLKNQHWPPIQIGIGINSGQMSVGDMGTRFRRNYTVLGDTVNIASRIESLSKYYSVPIIVTEATHKKQHRFLFRKLDRVRVKGRLNSIVVYEVICLRTEATPEILAELALHEQGLEAYFAKDWKRAEHIFNQLNEAHPAKKLYSIYLKRIDEFKKDGIPKNWDGVYVHLKK